MIVANVLNSLGTHARGPLYLVPNRSVARAAHVPVGRTLHLIDIENLAGGDFSVVEMASAAEAYRETAAVAAMDHVVTAVGVSALLSAVKAGFSGRMVVGRGVDGADHALLKVVANPERIAAQYDRIVIGSGDHIFCEAARELRARGIAVGVVSRAERLSRHLARAATFVREIPTKADLQDAA
jgi:hypothetical protein